ncbi:MAG: ABA4-like family protein [Novosphingobium sp.]
MWPILFTLTNVLAMAAWVILIGLPRKPLAHSAVLYLGVGLLCLIYTSCFAAVLTGAVSDGLSSDGDMMSVEGVRAFFATDPGVVIGWTHYLAFDLFTGLWIARDADAKGFSRLVQIPFLAMTFVAGPVGLLAWLIVRERSARAIGRG